MSLKSFTMLPASNRCVRKVRLVVGKTILYEGLRRQWSNFNYQQTTDSIIMCVHGKSIFLYLSINLTDYLNNSFDLYFVSGCCGVHKVHRCSNSCTSDKDCLTVAMRSTVKAWLPSLAQLTPQRKQHRLESVHLRTRRSIGLRMSFTR